MATTVIFVEQGIDSFLVLLTGGLIFWGETKWGLERLPKQDGLTKTAVSVFAVGLPSFARSLGLGTQIDDPRFAQALVNQMGVEIHPPRRPIEDRRIGRDHDSI